MTGRGIRARINGGIVEVGRLAIFEAGGASPPPEIHETVKRLEAAGRTTIVVRARANAIEWLGVLGVADEARPGIREVAAHVPVAMVGDGVNDGSRAGTRDRGNHVRSCGRM